MGTLFRRIISALRLAPGPIAICGLVALAALDIPAEPVPAAPAASADAAGDPCVTRDDAIAAASRYVERQGAPLAARQLGAIWAEARWTVYFWNDADPAEAPVRVDVSADGRVTGCDAGGVCAPAAVAAAPSCDGAASVVVARDDAERIARAFLARRLPGNAPRNALALWSEAGWLVTFSAGDGPIFVVEVSPRGDVAATASSA